MTESSTTQDPVSKWFFESLKASQQTEGALRTVRLELRHILTATPLDAEARTQLQETLRVLDRASGSLTILQASARNALDEILYQKTK